MTSIEYPFFSPLYLMAKPVGPCCNLRCSYCYYLEKDEVLGLKGNMMMSDEVLERFIRSYIEAQSGPYVQFTWHGGEAMLRKPDFYRKVVDIQHRYARPDMIVNSIQTNGTLITDEWCEFLSDNNWLVGVSIDGPREIHDAYRKNAAGKGTFDTVMKGIRRLQRYNVEWNAMAVVNNLNVKRPQDFYNFFKEIGCRYIQFTPIVERYTSSGTLASAYDDGMMSPQSVTPAEWGEFLCSVFDLWVRSDVGSVFVQLFDATLANWLGEMPGLCSMGKVCGHAGVIEHNGDVYSCDHFVFPEYKLGNIMNLSVVEMMSGNAQNEFAKKKLQGLTDKCRTCPYLKACYGECPKNRFVKIDDTDRRHNYLCEGYRRFFEHVEPYMDFMANEYKAQRPASNVMKLFR